MPGVVRRVLSTLLQVLLALCLAAAAGLAAAPPAAAGPGQAPGPTPTASARDHALPPATTMGATTPATAGAGVPDDGGVGTAASLYTTVALGALFGGLLLAGRRRERGHHPAAE